MPDPEPANLEVPTAPDVTPSESELHSSIELFRGSQTFIARSPHPDVIRLRIVTIAGLILFFFVGVPC